MRGANPPCGGASGSRPSADRNGDLAAVGLATTARGAATARRRDGHDDAITFAQRPTPRAPTADTVPDHSCPQIAGLYGRPDW